MVLSYFIIIVCLNSFILSVYSNSDNETLRNEQSMTVDPKGYIFFCLCMGRLGNQMEHFLGGLAFAKELDRTLVLPPFRTYKNVPFDEWFKVASISAYHRVILADQFMQDIAPSVWPPEKRPGFCYVPPTAEQKSCEIKIGNPFTNFWDELNVNFSEIVPYSVSYHEPEQWKSLFKPETYPVLALKGAPAAFPMWEPHVHLQSYLQFSDQLLEEVESLQRKYFNGTREYVGIHLRNGADWASTCELVDVAPRLMSSYQCLGFDYGRKLTSEMCFPSVDTVVQLTTAIVEKAKVHYLFVATDKDPLTRHFQDAMPGVEVVHIDPWLPLVDAMLLVDSKHFIGNCVSSFSSFVWRHRIWHNKGPTSHFGLTHT